jgi:5'-3' exonuclease
MDKAIVIDGLSLMFREFHALVGLKNKKGYGTGMAYGTLKQLFYLLTKYGWRSSHIILVWDRKPTWKFELFPGYKAKRKQLDLPEAMSVPNQMKVTKKMIELLGITQAYCKGHESDDVCATLAKFLTDRGREVVVVSSDHDLQQCLNKKCSLLVQTQSTERLYTEQNFIDEHDVLPDDYACVQTLGGCTTDKVPGMKGISEETAFKIIQKNCWQSIIWNADKMVFPSARACTMFRKGHPNWDYEKMMKLVRLQKTLKPTIERHKFDPARLRNLFVLLEFKSYLLPDHFDRLKEIFTR